MFDGAFEKNLVSMGLPLNREVLRICRSLMEQVEHFFSTDGSTQGASRPYTPVNADPENGIVLDRWTPE